MPILFFQNRFGTDLAMRVGYEATGEALQEDHMSRAHSQMVLGVRVGPGAL